MRRIAVARPPTAAAVAALLAVAAFVAISPPAAAEAPPRRIVAIGDIHGGLSNLRQILHETGLADASGRWTGGDAVFVQTGDFTDRGAEVRGVMDLLMDLQRQAPAAGGRVEVLLGNHEGMNLARELRDVGPEAFERFVDEGSESRRERAYKDWKTAIRRRFRAAGRGVPRFTDEVEASWMGEHPPGQIEYLEALGPDGRYGKWLRGLPTVAKIGGTLFIHGGLAPANLRATAESLNADVRAEIERLDTIHRKLVEAKVALPFYDRSEMVVALRDAVETGAQRANRGSANPALDAMLQELESHAVSGLLFHPEGPLWYRGYAHLADEELASIVTDTFRSWGVRRIVAGHNTSPQGRIESRLNAGLLLIDTGLLGGEDYPTGRPAALEIAGERVAAVYPRGETVTLAPLAPPAPVPATSADGGRPGLERTPGPGPHPAAPIAAIDPPEPATAEGLGLLGPDGEPLPFLTHEEVLDFLRTAPVIAKEEVGEGVTRPWRLTLEAGGTRARAVFHDVEIRKSRVHLRGQGFVMDFKDSYYNQVAAYEVSRLLGMDNVPPAVRREIDGVEGSVALWIEEAMRERDRLDQGLAPPEHSSWLHSFYDMRVFDNLINNTDRNAGNILMDGDWKVWLIDHTRAFGNAAGLFEPDKVVRCSRPLFERLRQLKASTVDPRLSPHVSIFEIRALFKRRDKLIQRLEAEIARRGENDVLFDPDPVKGVAAGVAVRERRRSQG